MTESQFTDNSQTGDLLIFRGFECPAKCQRAFTGAHYDHVALLVKKKGSLFVYESTSKDGVRLRSWRDFSNNLWNLLYDKMVYRKLNLELLFKENPQFGDEFQAKTIEFVNDTEKKNYTFSCCALLCGSKEDHEIENRWKDSKGFFCSQLVAAAYLKCGILKYKSGTGSYLPGSFSHSKKLEMHEKISIGPEVIIDFSE